MELIISYYDNDMLQNPHLLSFVFQNIQFRDFVIQALNLSLKTHKLTLPKRNWLHFFLFPTFKQTGRSLSNWSRKQHNETFLPGERRNL